MGGILEVAGVPGFLGNLKEMYERADAEGGVWRGFVALWWDRFGTQHVSVADLYELALQCSIPLARGDEHAKRTSLGQALGRMRDRIYTVGVGGCGSAMPVRARRAALAAGDLRDREAGIVSQPVDLVGLIRARIRHVQVGLRGGPPEAHPEKPGKINAPVGLVGLVGLFHPYACARTRAR